jgi:undecaprenyl pyrophosphate synthase
VGPITGNSAFGSRKPLGQLFQHLKKDIELPKDFEKYLQDGIDQRNELVHRFIRENIRLLSNESGRREAVEKIRAMAREVRKRDKVLGKLVDALLKKYGLSQAALKNLAGRLYN